MITSEDERFSYNTPLSFPGLTEETCMPSIRAGLNSLAHKTFAEFFAGIGLMRMGLERQGWAALYANDIDPKKKVMYKAHFNHDPSVFDLRNIDDVQPEEIPQVTLATSSFPCNDLSLAGSRSGLNGPRSSVFWGFIKIIDGLANRRRPPLILLENVTGFLSSRQGADLHEALQALNSMRYSVDMFVLDARLFVPQSRPRLFVVGTMNGNTNRNYFDCAMETALRPKNLTSFILGHPDINWNIRPLPTPISQETSLKDILEDLPDDAPEWWSSERAEHLLNQMNPGHRRVADSMIFGFDWSYGTVFRRTRSGRCMAELRSDGIAGCLRTPRGGSGRQILFRAGHGKYFIRLLTPRECAKLMGADDYRIEVSSNQALFGFGDAVCVPVIEWIAQHYLNPIVEELFSYESSPEYHRETRISA